MTIQELFDEYVSVSKDYQVSGVRQQQIIQEVEALVRKETIEEIQKIKVPEKQKSPSYSESDILRTNFEWNRLSGMSEMKSKIIAQLSKGVILD